MSEIDDDDRLKEAEQDLKIRLAEVQEGWGAYLGAHSGDERVQALIRVYEEHGAKPFDPDAVLTKPLPDKVQSQFEYIWYWSGRHPFDRSWSWIMQTLRNSNASMTPIDDREKHNTLPERVQLWRGFACHPDVIEERSRRFAWTQNYDVAKDYADREKFHPEFNGYIASTVVPREAIHSVFSLGGRLNECIIDRPDLIEEISYENLGQHSFWAKPASVPRRLSALGDPRLLLQPSFFDRL